MRTRRRHARWPAEEGAVALETALVAPVVALLVAGVLGLTAVVVDQLTVERVARTVARSVAVSGTQVGTDVALPPGTTLTVSRRGRTATVVVSASGRILGIGYTVEGRATTALEPALP
jgi:hypothetical protein